MLVTRKPLFLGSRYNPTIDDQSGGSVMIECRNPQNRRHNFGSQLTIVELLWDESTRQCTDWERHDDDRQRQLPKKARRSPGVLRSINKLWGARSYAACLFLAGSSGSNRTTSFS